MTPNNCMKDLPTGVKCKGDHSKLLFGSGNAYCYAARAVQKVTKVVSDSVDKQFDSVNESAETVCYFQDIPVVGHNYMARTFWDEGSNRVLIRQDFADKLFGGCGTRTGVQDWVHLHVEYQGHVWQISQHMGVQY